MGNSIIIFIHLVGAAVGLGATVFCMLLWPRLNALESGKELDENSVTYKVMDLLMPTVFVCVLVLVGSGIYYLMENYTDQVNLKDGYYNILGIKLMFAVVTFFLSAYATFGLRARIAHLDLRPENKKLVRPTLDTLKILNQVMLGTLGFAVFLGIYLARF